MTEVQVPPAHQYRLQPEGWGEGDQLAASSTTASKASGAHLSEPFVNKFEHKSL